MSGAHERTSGIGAAALWFHVERPSRAVPECERLSGSDDKHIAIMGKHPWNIFFLVGFVIYVVIRGVFKERVKGNKVTIGRVDALEKALMLIVIPGGLLLPVVYLFTPWLAFADYHLPTLAPWCGAVLMTAALWLFWRSHADLGLNWSQSLEIRKGHQLVTQGVYRSVRHPMYASIWIWCLAQGLLLENWLAGWYAFVAFALMYFIRRPREERMMCERFGNEYRDYMRHTGRVVPRIKRWLIGLHWTRR